MVRKHFIAQNPNDKMFYVLGYAGKHNSKAVYIPVSDGYKSRTEAQKYLNMLPLAEIDMRQSIAQEF